tara:strand:+ start:774 stop:1157 length:384 start_codon:yes stop_codon:yes gene_type:complete
MVLSLFWVAGLFFAMRPDQTYQEYSAAKMDLGESNGLISADTLIDAAERAIAADEASPAANRLFAMAEVAKRSPDGLYKTKKRKTFERRFRGLKEEIGFIFLPPIIAFIIGACLAWALRGFQRRPTA